MDFSPPALNSGRAMIPAQLGWLGIVRLGLVQTALGAIVVLMTSVVNRVLVVELALPAFIPGGLVALHYGVQVLRPRWGYGSDVGGRRTIWIIGGMAILACGGLSAAVAAALIASHPMAGLGLAIIAFILVGGGVGAAGTSLLTLLAGLVAPDRRPAAATITWIMMIAGIAITAYLAGQFLDPFSFPRLIAITAIVASLSLFVTVVAVWKIESTSLARKLPARPNQISSSPASSGQVPFREALGQVWNEPQSRRFAIFVFVSMLAYSAQELLLEPFAGIVFHFTPGEFDQAFLGSARRCSRWNAPSRRDRKSLRPTLVRVDAAVDFSWMRRIGGNALGYCAGWRSRAAMVASKVRICTRPCERHLRSLGNLGDDGTCRHQ